jgi:NAD(P)-dependent dehydrogenase (short-subunit alcohol dehydrogenase family)
VSTALDDDLLHDRVVLVSGGTQGVGAAVARAAVRNGAQVVVTGRRRDVGAALVDELTAIGGTAAYVACDVAEVGQCRDAVSATLDRFGRVDCLVNAAGLTTRGSLVDTTPELFDAHVAVNVRGPFFLMQAFVQDLLSRGAPGTVVNVITMTSHGGQPTSPPTPPRRPRWPD